MKAILLTTALAAFGLAVLPLHADDASPKPAVEKAAVQTTPVYLVQVSGAGWGIPQRTSLALKSQEGVQKVLFSGLRATVVMEDGKVLDQEKSTKAIEAKGLAVKSFSKTEIAIPESGYALTVAGMGWANTSDKVRVALEKLDGITGAYVNRNIIIHLAKAGALDQAKIAEALKPFKMTIKEVKALEGKLL